LSKLSEKSAKKSEFFEAPTLADAAQLCGISAISAMQSNLHELARDLERLSRPPRNPAKLPRSGSGKQPN
jgi:hypothetical protein